jgi:CheY-like chemotaxis protein
MRGAELTQRLLAFSRKQTLSPRVVDLNELVADMTDMLRRTLGETIEIDVAGGDDLLRCDADPGQLENAILNLALNGRDAMPRGGRLTIETANVKLDGTDVAARNDVSPGEYVMIAVSDTGTGMSPDVIDHAFDPFFTTKGVGAGSGLGLSMVHGFINQSGGFVTIDSTEGVGTKVNLYLPRSRQTRTTAQRSANEKDPVSQGEMVLVVEDDSDVRKMTVNMLADLGYRTIEAGNGKQAIEVLQRPGEIDLLFTDVVLPGDMSGIRIAEEAARRCPGIKILLTSGYAETVLDQHGPVAENIQLIKKPFRKATLAQTVRVVLDQPVQ